MEESNKMNLESDYLTHRAEIIDKFGEVFADAIDTFFERAVEEANNDLLDSAIRDAKLAYDLGVYQQNDYALIYLIGFLCETNLNAGSIGKAKEYLEIGYKMLDKRDADYERDKLSFNRLKEIIDGESWKI
jgi:hypothetical protein